MVDRAEWLTGCQTKIARADHHLQALYAETDGWGDTDPFRVVRQSNADGSEHIYRLNFRVPPDTWRWGVLLGDAMFNLRCALDHIVYALAINQSGQDPPPNAGLLMFPIASGEGFFTSKRTQSRIAGLNEPTRTAIERAQPYNRRKTGQWFMPLWWLSQLNDIDKHRLVHLTPIAAKQDDIVIPREPGTFRALWNEGPLVNGTPFFRLLLNPPDPNVQVDIKATAAIALQFKEMKPFGLHPIAEAIRKEVVLVCRYLSRFLTDGGPSHRGPPSIDPGVPPPGATPP
jgi:hypothetical protein